MQFQIESVELLTDLGVGTVILNLVNYGVCTITHTRACIHGVAGIEIKQEPRNGPGSDSKPKVPCEGCPELIDPADLPYCPACLAAMKEGYDEFGKIKS